MARSNVATKHFVDGEGNETRHAGINTTGVLFKFAGGHEAQCDLSELPEGILTAAAAHGLSQKGGDAYAGSAKETEPVAWAIDRLETVWDNLKNGVWITSREGDGAPRLTMLCAAIVRAAVAKGKDIEEIDQKALMTKLQDEDVRKAAMQNREVLAEYKTLQAENAAARAEAARQAVVDNEDEDETGPSVLALV